MSENLEITLTNARAERIKKVAALTGRSARSKTGTFLVEGPQSVREVVKHAPETIRDLYVTADAAAKYYRVVNSALKSEVFVHGGTDEVLDAISKDCQGMVAVVDSLSDNLDTVLAGKPKLVAVLSNVRDPGNAGTAIRVADAAGADAVVFAGESVDIMNPKVVRSSVGSLFHIPVVRNVPLDVVAVELSGAGLQLFAADGAGTIVLGEAGADAEALAKPTAWIFGNEAWGLSQEERDLADSVVRVPIYGSAESLNLGTAAAVCLYASASAQRT